MLNAIRKVEKYCAEVASHKTMTPSPPANFLKRHILGVISHISGILQDDQGKKPLVVKMQGIRCIKQLIAIIGPQINVIAPQVSGFGNSLFYCKPTYKPDYDNNAKHDPSRWPGEVHP